MQPLLICCIIDLHRDFMNSFGNLEAGLDSGTDYPEAQVVIKPSVLRDLHHTTAFCGQYLLLLNTSSRPWRHKDGRSHKCPLTVSPSNPVPHSLLLFSTYNPTVLLCATFASESTAGSRLQDNHADVLLRVCYVYEGCGHVAPMVSRHNTF